MKVALAHFQWFNEFRGGAERNIADAYDLLKDSVDYNIISGYEKSPEGIPDRRHLAHYKSGQIFMKHLQYHIHTRNAIESINPDIVHSMSLSTCIKKPFICWSTQIDYTNTDHWFLKSPMFSALAKHVFEKSDAIQVHTNCLKKQILARFKLPEEKIKVIEQPVDKNFVPDRRLRHAARENLGLADKTILYFPARVIPNKRQDILINSLNLVDKEIRKNIVVLISGMVQNQKYFNYLKRISEGLPVLFKENYTKNLDLYNAADIVVHPRDVTESGGSIIPEAMAMKKPMILSAVESFVEMSKGNALFFEPGSHSDLARKIETIFLDKTIHRNFVKNGSRIFKQYYSQSSFCKKQMCLYENTLRNTF